MFDLAFLEVLSIGWMTIIFFCNCAPFINFRSSLRMKMWFKRTILFFSNLIVFHSLRPPLKKKSSSAKFVKCISLIGFRASRHSNSASWLRPAVIMGPFFIPSFLSYTASIGYFDIFYNLCTFYPPNKTEPSTKSKRDPIVLGSLSNFQVFSILQCSLHVLKWCQTNRSSMWALSYPIPSRPLFGHVAIPRNIAVITPPAGERKETLQPSISCAR